MSQRDGTVADSGPAAQSRTFPSEFGSVTLARQFITHSLRRPPAVPDDVVADVELAVSELATNGVRHGSGDPVTIDLSRDNRVVRVSVTSTLKRGADGDTETWERRSPTGPSGRGIGVVRAVSAGLTYRISGRAVLASCSFVLPM
jgi:anti-sigma regulatory factor (Ser/Thr protein kinase)